jgi:hydrogenase maturation protease
LNRILLIGYGNPDRQDDGVAWHILQALVVRLGYHPVPQSYEDEFPINDLVDFSFNLQLTPEMAEDISAYEHVCFVDAHTGDIPEEVRLIEVESEFQHSPFTHHLTSQSLLSMCETIYHKKPRAGLVSVRGFSFGFTQDLSEATRALVPEAVELITAWMNL